MPLPTSPLTARLPSVRRATAVVYCEANFGQVDGKTANGLVRHSERYEVVAVIDSQQAGGDAGLVLDGSANGIPLRRDLVDALDHLDEAPQALIFGIAPTTGVLSLRQRAVVLDAIDRGLDIVSGLHEFLGDDPVFAAAALLRGVTILDVRRPREKKDLRTFTGRVRDVTSIRIAVLGTDCAIGKRTTATILTQALVDRGVHAVMIGTGQTSLIQGARYGVGLDAVPAQFGAGEMEAAVLEAWDAEQPDVMVIEGQGALSHPAYSSSALILRGSRPHGVIVQHAPARRQLADFPSFPMPTVDSEIGLIEAFADTKVIGVTINHENLSDDEVSTAMVAYEVGLGLPVTDVLTRPTDILVDMVMQAFPQLDELAPAALG